jgi:hypothetical protein
VTCKLLAEENEIDDILFLSFCLCVRLCPYFKVKRTRSHILCNFMSVLFLVLFYLHPLGPNVAEKKSVLLKRHKCSYQCKSMQLFYDQARKQLNKQTRLARSPLITSPWEVFGNRLHLFLFSQALTRKFLPISIRKLFLLSSNDNVSLKLARD